MKDFTVGRISLKTIVGIALIALSFIMYEIFQITQNGFIFPLAVAPFVIGFHLVLSKIRALQSIKRVLTLLVIGGLLISIFMIEGWNKDILDSRYAMEFAKTTTAFTVSFLNLLNIHATQDGNTIILPTGSKISALVVTPACSGLESSGVFIVAFVLMLIDLGYKAPKKKLVTLFVLGTVSILFANMLRIAFLGYVAYVYGYDTLITDHTYSGPIIFLSLIGLFWWLSLRWISKKPQSQISHQDIK